MGSRKEDYMRCFGKYRDDRLCDMCKENGDCQEDYNLKLKEWRELEDIKKRCPHYARIWSRDRYQYDACKLKKDDWDYISCNPSKECLKEQTLAPIIREDHGTTIIYCPNNECNYSQYGNSWDYDKCPECGQRTKKII